MSNNFKLQFGNKNVLVQYNDAQDARVFTYGEDGRNGEATQFARALHHMMAGTYPIQGKGLYMHRSFREAAMLLKDDNLGYVNFPALSELVLTGVVKERKETNPDAWYRIHAEMGRFWSEELKWIDKVKGEPRWVAHNRRALALMPYMERLNFAEANGYNIRILFAGKIEFIMDDLHDSWNLFQNGAIDEIKAKLNRAATTNQVKGTIERYEELIGDEEETNGEKAKFVIEIAPDLALPEIGKIIKFTSKNGVDLAITQVVTQKNLAVLMKTIDAHKLTWAYTEVPTVKAGRNVPVPIEDEDEG